MGAPARAGSGVAGRSASPDPTLVRPKQLQTLPCCLAALQFWGSRLQHARDRPAAVAFRSCLSAGLVPPSFRVARESQWVSPHRCVREDGPGQRCARAFGRGVHDSGPSPGPAPPDQGAHWQLSMLAQPRRDAAQSRTAADARAARARDGASVWEDAQHLGAWDAIRRAVGGARPPGGPPVARPPGTAPATGSGSRPSAVVNAHRMIVVARGDGAERAAQRQAAQTAASGAPRAAQSGSRAAGSRGSGQAASSGSPFPLTARAPSRVLSCAIACLPRPALSALAQQTGQDGAAARSPQEGGEEVEAL